MGIYIKGLKAPENCCDCRRIGWSNLRQVYICDVYDKPIAKLATDCFTGIPEWCPITNVPEPHGDLIDRDALGVGEYEREDYDSGTLEISLGGLLDIYHKVKKAPTVIAREDGDAE